MQCRSVEKRVQELLDNRLDPSFDSELTDHASMCAECRDLLEAHRELFDGLPLLTVPSLPADFSRRVVEAVVTQQRRPPQRLAPAAAFLAIIATLLLVFALGPPQSKSISPADDTHAIASASLSQSLGGSAAGHAMAEFDSREVRLAIEQFVAQLTSPEAARYYQVDQLAGTIRPLASTLNVAFDAIRRSIPRRRHPSHPDPQAGCVRDLRSLRVI